MRTVVLFLIIVRLVLGEAETEVIYFCSIICFIRIKLTEYLFIFQIAGF